MMKKEWSSNWLSSVQPRKQRKYRYNAPLHVRQGFLKANLSKELRKRFNKRSLQVRKGDEIKVMRGNFKGKTGTIEKVDLRSTKVFVDEIKVKKVDGSEVPRPLHPSNIMLTKLKLDDKKRQTILDRADTATQRGTGKKVAAKPAPIPETPVMAQAPKPTPKKEIKSAPKKASKPVKKNAPVKKAAQKKPVTKKKK
jgi:large subunit ribosomal protein L24